MNFSNFAAPHILVPVHDLRRLRSPAPSAGNSGSNMTPNLRYSFTVTQALAGKSAQSPTQSALSAQRTRKPLRIIRVLEEDHVPANVGRMVISGRMADVCAELDRLADREAALH